MAQFIKQAQDILVESQMDLLRRHGVAACELRGFLSLGFRLRDEFGVHGLDFVGLAEELDLDTDRFASELESGTYEDYVSADTRS